MTENFPAGTCFYRRRTYREIAVTSPTGLLVAPDAVLLDLDCGSGEEAVRALHARLAAASNAVMDGPTFLTDLLARMRLGPVCIAEEIAMPHARTAAVDRLVIGVARSASGIPFDPQHSRVGLVFLVGTPMQAVGEYLRVVASLTRWLRDATRRAALFSAPDGESFRALLAGGVLARQ